MARPQSRTSRKRKSASTRGNAVFINIFLAFLVVILILGILVMLLYAFMPPVNPGSSLVQGVENTESPASPLVVPSTKADETTIPGESPSPEAQTNDQSTEAPPSTEATPRPQVSSPVGTHPAIVSRPAVRPMPSPAPASASPVPLASLPGIRKPVLYLVLDDAGYDPAKTVRFLKIHLPLTIAVLPGLPDSAKVADLVRKAGNEVLLHQPMDAVGDVIKAPGLITSAEAPGTTKARLEANIESLGTIVGINNHQGSRGTQDIALMRSIMSVLKKHGLFFLDSRTTALTVADRASRETGVAFMKRDIFLDNIADENEIRKALEKGMDTARKQGYAVMIGHVWSDELYDVLLQDHLDLQSRGFSFEMLSSFLMYRNPARPETVREPNRP